MKLQKRAARVILDCDFTAPSSLMSAELKWMIFPERVIYQKTFQMFKSLREKNPLITLGHHLLLRLIFMHSSAS